MVIAVGFGLRALSRVLETAGDIASDPGSRLANHVSALVVLVAAGACFIWAFKMIFFDKPREKAEPESASGQSPQYIDIYPDRRDDEAGFDPDAALARYMDDRPAAPTAPKPSDFGRKGL